MGRMPRFDLPGIAQHVVQRGKNRLPCFLDDADRLRYLTLLGDVALRYGVRVHAYVLMSNHVHLLVTPDEKSAVSRAMQTLGRNYASYFNVRHDRTGTLWEGRFKSCLVDSEAYVLRCYRYIELNPVRAWMVERPEDYAWSSHRANLGLVSSAMLSPHAEFARLGPEAESRGRAYAALVAAGLSDDLLHDIRIYLQQQRALGTDRFREQVEARIRRFSGVRPPHRPRRASSAAGKKSL
jgi:putative transposase